MKSRKLMAVLVMVAMIVTALPLVAFGANRFDSVFEVNREKVVADGARSAKFTVYTMQGGNVVTGQKVYFASNRGGTDTFSAKPEYLGNQDGNIFSAVSNESGKVEVEVKSYSTGKATIGISLQKEVTTGNSQGTLYDYLTGETVNTASLELLGTQVVEFTPESLSGVDVSSISGVTVVRDAGKIDKDHEHSDGKTRGNGVDNYEVELKISPAIRGEEIKLSANKAAVRFNKTTVETNIAGVAKVKVYADKPGPYTIKATTGGETVQFKLRFIAGDVANVKLESGGGDVNARKEDYSFKLRFEDINGHKSSVLDVDTEKVFSAIGDDDYLGKNHADLEFDVLNEPSDSDLDTGSFKVKEDDGFLKVTIPGTYLTEEGKYRVRAQVGTGRYADVEFEVKEQGKIVELQLSYKQSALALGQQSSGATVKLVDSNGVKKDADKDNDVTFVVSDVRMIQNDINEDKGVIKATDEDKYAGTLVITAIDKEHNVTDTFTMEIGVEATSFEVTVPEGEMVVGEDAVLEIQFYDANGNAVALGENYDNDDIELEYVVVKKPADAFVSVDAGSKFAKNLKETGKATVEVYSNEVGTVEVQLVVKAKSTETDATTKYFTNRVSLPFGVAPEDKVVEGAKKVLLTIGNNFAVVDGEMEEFDAPAYIEGGRTYVPFRFLGEAFGAEVDWAPKDAAVETVFLTRDDMELSIGIGDAFLTVTKDGEVEVQAFDGAAVVKDGRTYLPFRAIAEAFEAEVDFGTDAEGFVTWVSFAQ